MKYYTLKKSRPLKHVESTQLAAAAKLVDALHNGTTPEQADLETIGLACQEMLRGVPTEEAWGITQGRGRPRESGFTNAEIVSAYIELERRKLGKERGALSTAKSMAAIAFRSDKEVDPRKIQDYWSNGKDLVSSWPDEDLKSLLCPHKLPDKKTTYLSSLFL